MAGLNGFWARLARTSRPACPSPYVARARPRTLERRGGSLWFKCSCSYKRPGSASDSPSGGLHGLVDAGVDERREEVAVEQALA